MSAAVPLSALPSWQHDGALIGLALILLAALWGALRHSQTMRRQPGALIRIAALIIAWQVVMAALALLGYFAVFSQPWRALPTIGLTLAVTVYAAMRPSLLDSFCGVPTWVWPALQSFRLPLELLLYSLFLHDVIGRQMTFGGYNFDVLVGVTAPLIAWLLYTQGRSAVATRLSALWNLAGLALLFNILVIAVLSVPFAFQVFTQEPANRMVAAFPFIWLPTFFIPLALFSHLVALRYALHDLRQPLPNATESRPL